MTCRGLAQLAAALIVSAWFFPLFAQAPEAPAVPAENGLRGLADIHAYASKAEQMDAVVPACEKLEAAHLEDLAKTKEVTPATRWVAAICPHDDYVYAGQVYVDAVKNVRAKTIILFGVCHRARPLGLKDKLIFDTFKQWRGPYGAIPVSPLREDIQRRLPKDEWLVSDEAQSVEWSVEGIVPWLQYYNRDVTIVSILVPHMDWPRTDAIAKDMGRVLAGLVKEKNLKLGEDVAFVMSCDATHYGDQWDDWAYDPFGCGVEGYVKAQAQDEILVREFLDGTLERGKVQRLAESLVDQKDVTRYKVTWCGRFSVTFGLAALTYMSQDLGRPPLVGVNTGYGTSIALGFLPFEKLGLSATAHENLHHWVSYVAEGYR